MENKCLDCVYHDKVSGSEEKLCMFYNEPRLIQKEVDVCESYVAQDALPVEETESIGNNSILDKAIEIFQGLKKGKTIEMFVNGKWYVYEGSIDNLFLGMSNMFKLRVKPQPTYRPYANAIEVFNAFKEHGPLMRWGSEFISPNFMPDKIWFLADSYGEIINKTYTFKEAFENLVWQDCSPCGVLEE